MTASLDCNGKCDWLFKRTQLKYWLVFSWPYLRAVKTYFDLQFPLGEHECQELGLNFGLKNLSDQLSGVGNYELQPYLINGRPVYRQIDGPESLFFDAGIWQVR